MTTHDILTVEDLRLIAERFRVHNVTASRFVPRGQVYIFDIDDDKEITDLTLWGGRVPADFKDWKPADQFEFARKTGMRIVANTDDYNAAMEALALERFENEGGSVS